jgi:hypothetical protein
VRALNSVDCGRITGNAGSNQLEEGNARTRRFFTSPPTTSNAFRICGFYLARSFSGIISTVTFGEIALPSISLPSQARYAAIGKPTVWPEPPLKALAFTSLPGLVARRGFFNNYRA